MSTRTPGPTEAVAPFTRPPDSRSTTGFYFSVGIWKLIVLSTASFGLYHLLWFYRYWRYERDVRREFEDISPIWRTVLSIFFSFKLFTRVREEAHQRGIRTTFEPGLLGAAYLLCVIAARLPDPYWLLSLLSVVPLIPVQQTVNALHALYAPDVRRNERFSGWNWLLIVVGLAVLGLVLLGMALPPEAPVDVPDAAPAGIVLTP